MAAVWEDLSSDNLAYWRALARWWAPDAPHPKDDLMVVEHDVVIRQDVIDQFDACPEPWCVFPYDPICCQDETGWSPCMEAWANMLGCTRFRKELIAAVPDAVSSIPDDPRVWVNQDPRDWHNLCDSIAGDKVEGMPAPLRPGSLRAAGFTHHWHSPGVRHISWEGHER